MNRISLPGDTVLSSRTSYHGETVLNHSLDEDPALLEEDLLSSWLFFVGLQGLFFPCQSQPVSNNISYCLCLNIYMSTSHFLWWWCTLLCFVVDMYAKWLDSTTCTEVVIWFIQMLLQSIRQLCNICCVLNSLSDWPVGKVIFFWLLADIYLLSSPERKERNSHIYLLLSAKSL